LSCRRFAILWARSIAPRSPSFALRSVAQAIAEPATEVAATVQFTTSTPAFQATEPLAPAAEHGGSARERDQLVDVEGRTVTILGLVEQPHAVLFCPQRD
jgi:hypothetical protein